MKRIKLALVAALLIELAKEQPTMPAAQVVVKEQGKRPSARYVRPARVDGEKRDG